MTESKQQIGAGLWDYLKEAFLFRWNLLALVGATAAAVISPAPDVVLPLVAAAELAYLAGLTSIPRFRSAVDAKVHAQNKGATGAPARATMKTLAAMFNGLESSGRHRFERLRARCVSMQSIAHGVRGRTGPADSSADDLRTSGLDRLLWVFLRLLYSQQALERFLAATDGGAIEKTIRDLESREAAAQEQGSERIARSLQDSIATARLRLDNYQKARSNAEFVSVELDRIEGKIQAISEMAISHQDPDYISSQVDSVAESMAHTEEAIRELNAITGLTDELDAPPPILETRMQ
jgi:DNA-binding FrmR family transcriptional regulator